MEAEDITAAYRLLGDAIRTTPGLYVVYQANIAMAMVDECEKQGLDLDIQVMHKLANDGAARFLNIWAEERPK